MPSAPNAKRRISLIRVVGSASTAKIAVIIFILSSLIYAVSPQARSSYLDLKHGSEVVHIALTLSQEGEFAHPFNSIPTGPTAHAAPVYVFLFATVAKLFGTGRLGFFTLWSLNVGFLAVQLALLPVLSEQLGLGIAPGIVAAALGVIVQPYHVLPEWESLFTGALLVTLCVLTLPYFKWPRDWQHSLLLGVLWGVTILTNPQCALLLFAWPHIAAIENPPEQMARARRAMLMVVAGAILACLPWFVRNYQRFHAVFFVRDNLGLELFVSNNSCAKPTMLDNLLSGCHKSTHPNPNPEIAGEVIDKGEIAFNRDRMQKALAWIKSNPRAFVRLTGKRFLRFWFPYLSSLRYAIPTGILTILSFAGIAGMFRTHRRAALLFSSTLFLFPLIHYVVQFEARYRYPIFWATFLPAAYAILQIVEWFRGARQKRTDVSDAEAELVTAER
jgi:hypothetical protein